MSYRDRIDEPGPKKLLSLDGGGIRGIVTLEVLAAIEEMLRRELRRSEDFVLADYFDYIGGTSTGAIIAAGLARGMPVATLQELYTRNGADMFDRASIIRRWRYKFHDSRLKATLQELFGADTTFGDAEFKSLLMMVLRNATTDSPWPLSNNPGAKYNQAHRSDNNLHLPLWRLVRASTAAPTYFPPETVQVGEQEFLFVDGGVTMYNNPAFQLFLMATLPAYELRWPTGVDQLLLVSVGTGSSAKADDHLRAGDMNVLYNATSIPAALMSAALHEQDFLCRVFGDCRFGATIDRELGDLMADPRRLCEPLFSYVRYDAALDRRGLDALGLPQVEPETVQQLDSIEHITDLQAVGMRVARSVRPEHFAHFLGRP
ncbi:patatin-like phospholipase family protein [Kineococcus glutinatus]|uniref:PNPLA domain-containing protein n=1 Tax=Kineococcus glutinatus TaxID=1070872 RepID=A0ABP9H840_9ACTN